MRKQTSKYEALPGNDGPSQGWRGAPPFLCFTLAFGALSLWFPSLLEPGACCGDQGGRGSGRSLSPPIQGVALLLLFVNPPGRTVSLSVPVSRSWSPGRLAEMPSPGLVMENGQVLPAFLLCSTLLVIKMYVVAVITGHTRLRKKVRGLLPPLLVMVLGDGGDQHCAGFSLQESLRTEKTWPRCACQRAAGAASELPSPQPFGS